MVDCCCCVQILCADAMLKLRRQLPAAAAAAMKQPLIRFAATSSILLAFIQQKALAVCWCQGCMHSHPPQLLTGAGCARRHLLLLCPCARSAMLAEAVHSVVDVANQVGGQQ
jgi:hypothetical protein